ncbi:hypothetical protein L2E82_10129 [Cichorium intybus]|uniref:Uncharacterized protein n=1 Tax=Cichorium intybus TaxID=13427 RepID=A0ACB9GAS1_CICIN|nr:hypothetical protein L2E82_10129 [Cichorium intybus]
MIATMNPELQRIYEDYWPFEMHKELAEKFRKQERIERCEVVKDLTNSKPKDGESICAHVKRMQGYVERLRKLAMPVPEELAVDIVLNSLPSSYDQFRLAYHLNNNQANLTEFHRMLRVAEDGMKANPNEADCFYCKEKGHWKRSCPKYLQDVKDGKVKPSTIGPKGKQGGHSVNYIDSTSGVKKACLSDDVCESCLLGKMTKSPFKGSFEKGEGLLDIIHTVVCGPFRSTTKDGTRFYVTFTDDFSRYGYIYLIKHKSDTFEKFKEFKNEVENKLGRKIKMLRSDRGGEYLSIEFLDYLKECGIVSQLTPPRTPQLNGVAERRNRTLLDMVHSMMSRASLPIHFWGYALETAAHILNLVPTKKVAKTPHEIPSEDVVFVARRAVFRERESSYSKSTVGVPLIWKKFKSHQMTQPYKKLATNMRKKFLLVRQMYPYLLGVPVGLACHLSFYGFHITSDGDTFISDRTLINLDEPANYQEAVAGPESAKWKEAMDSEIKSMYDNQVWNLVDNVQGGKTVRCKWIFKKTTDMDGKVHTFKARLVVKGFTQTPGVDYDETFSPVAKIKSIRIMLAIAAFHDYEIWQMDVKTAFLNGKLTEDVYMNQPEGFVDARYPNKMCKLERSIYGLKQASRSWNLCFHEKVKEFGFSRSEDESCVYVKASGSIVTFLVLYVDDILLMGNDIPTLQDVKAWLGKCFAMKDLGEAAYILGIRILRDRKKRLIGLSQGTYLEKVLKRFSMENSKKGELPIQSNAKLRSIMYAMTCTRPDVPFALSMDQEHGVSPSGSDTLRVEGYTDASFQTDRDSGRSRSGWVFLLNGGAVTWKISKQETVADSTCESEYIAASEASKEPAWLKNFIGDLGVVLSIQEPLELFCDNEGAVALTKEPRDHGKSRYIDRKYHYIRYRVEEGHLLVKRVSSEDNPADPLTKALSRIKHNQHARSIVLRDDISFCN